MQKHKKFFREPTESVVKDLNIINIESFQHSNLVNRILDLQEKECIVLNGQLLPSIYQNSWHFLKHGSKVSPNGHHAFRAFKKRKFTPFDLRVESFNDLNPDILYSGYEYFPLTIWPYSRIDNRIRRVGLVECLEGARLFAYSHQILQDGIEIEDYSQSGLVATEGATFHAHVPSRTQHGSRYRINVYHVPIAGNFERYFISRRTETDVHNCRRSQYINIRYSEDQPEVFDWCAHGVAAYLEIAYKKFNNDNKTPMIMSQMALPTDLTVKFYKRLCDSVFVDDGKLKPLTKADQELLLWELVKEKKHFNTFFGYLPNTLSYDWTLRYV